MIPFVPAVRESKSGELFEYISLVFVLLGMFPSLALALAVAGDGPDNAGGGVSKPRAPPVGRGMTGGEGM